MISNGYSVTYNGNGNTGGTVPVDENTYSAGATVTVAGNTGNLVKTGYTFAGWNSSADGSGTNRAVGSTFDIDSGAVNLYAKWTLNSSGARQFFRNNTESPGGRNRHRKW